MSTFTSAVVQHSRQHDADFRRALVRKDSAPHQQLKPEQIKWPMIFILPAPAGRRRSGGNNQ